MPARSGSAHLLLLLAASLAGCASTARQRVENCEQRVQTLSAETDQLRKETIALRNRNRDLAQRSVDDARRLRDAEMAARRLEKAVASYQEERQEITQAFQSLQDQVLMQAQGNRPASRGPQASTKPPGQLNPARFEAFARSQPGARFDPDRASWFFPTDSLFQSGTAELSPRARLVLDAFVRLLIEPDDPATPSHVAARAAAASVVRASATLGNPPTSSLAEARADRVRRELARRLAIDPASIPYSGTELDPDAIDDPAPPDLLGVEIELKPTPR